MTKMAYLHEVADVFNGKTPAKSDQRSQGFPVLKIRDVDRYGNFKGLHESFVEDSFAAKFRAKWVQSGDTLVLNAAHNADYVGSKVFFARESVTNTLPTGEWLLVRAKENILHPGYINYWLRCDRTRKAIRFLVKGIHLYPKDVATLQLPIPPFEEQERIVDLLSRAEGIVKLRREAQKKAAELIPAIFMDMFGDPARNPKGWPVKPLVEVVSFMSGGTPPKAREDLWSGTLPWVSPKDMKVDCIADAIDHVSDSVLTETNLKLVPIGSILIVVRGMILVHTVPIAITSTPVTINQDMKALMPIKSIDPSFLLWALKVQHTKLLALVDTAAHGTKKLDTAKIQAVGIPVPPLQIQRQFIARADSVASIMAQQDSALNKAKATFEALLARSFTTEALA